MTRKETNRVRETAHFPAFDMGAPHSPPPTVTKPAALTPFQELLKRLSEAFGPSGSEEIVGELVREEIKGLADQVRTDALGNLIALRKGSGNGRKKILLAAPLDEIGVMVTFLDARGFARFGMLGAVNPLTLLGARVQFENGAVGVFGRESRNASRTQIETDAMFLDVGASSEENAPVRVGDAACFVSEFRASGDYVMGKALGVRASCAVLMEALRRVKKTAHDVYCVFTVQHQVGARGAGAAAYAIQPDYAFVLAPTKAQDIPGGESSNIALGKGPAILVHDDAMIASQAARKVLIQLARSAHVPYQVQVHAHTGGDGTPIQATREGIVTGALALPTRYLQTPSEMLDARDIENTIEHVSQLLTTRTI